MLLLTMFVKASKRVLTWLAPLKSSRASEIGRGPATVLLSSK